MADGNFNNVNASGHVSAVGNVTGSNLKTNGIVSSAGNVIGNSILAYGQIVSASNVSGGNILASVRISAVGNITGGNLRTSGNLIAGNISTSGTITGQLNVSSLSIAGNVQANYFIGNGSLLTNVNASNIIGAYSNANVANYLPINSTIITINSNVSNTNSNVANLSTQVAGINSRLIATNSNVANLSANVSVINSNLASLTTSVAGINSNVTVLQGQVYSNANVSSYLSSYTGAVTAGSFSATGNINTPGTIFANNISTNYFNVSQFSVTSLSASGTITAGRFLGNGSSLTGISGNQFSSISTGGNVTAGYFIGDGSQLTGITAGSTSTAVTVTAGSQPNITSAVNLTSVGTLGNLTVNNNINSWSIRANGSVSATTFVGGAGNISTTGYFIGNGSLLTGITSTASTVATVTANAQPNITSVGTLSSLTVTGNVVANNINNGPIFMAYQRTSQTIPYGNGVFALLCDNPTIDTNSGYNISTGKFTPTVAGYYQINAAFDSIAGVLYPGDFTSSAQLNLYKNNIQLAISTAAFLSEGLKNSNLSTIVYLNGRGDYVQLGLAYVHNYLTSWATNASPTTFFQACWLRP